MGRIIKDSKINGERIIHEDIANEHYHYIDDIVDFGILAGKYNNKNIYAERIHDHTLEDLYERYLHEDNNVMKGYLKVTDFDDNKSLINKAYADNYVDTNIIKNKITDINEDIPVSITREPKTLVGTNDKGEIHWSRFHINNIENEFRPSLNGPVSVNTGNSYQYTITNYNSFANYNISISEGTATLDGDTINIDVPSSVNNNLILTITTESYTSNYIISVNGVTGYNEIVLNGPERVESIKTYEFTIANYDPNKTYTVSTNIGQSAIDENRVIIKTPSGNRSETEIVITITDGSITSNHTVAFDYNEIVIDGPNSVKSNNSYEFIITNYDSLKNYNVSTNIGKVSLSQDKLTLETPSENNNEQIISIIVDNEDSYKTHNVTFLYDDIILHPLSKTLIAGKVNSLYIYNYNYNRQYNVTTNVGNAIIEHDEIKLDLTNINNENTVEITISDVNVSTKYSYNIMYLDKNDIILNGPQIFQAGNIYTLTIDNYDLNSNYEVNSNIGDITIDGEKITVDLTNITSPDVLNLTISNDILSTEYDYDVEKQLVKDLNGAVYSVSADNTVKKLDMHGQLLWSYGGFINTVWCIDIDNYGNIYCGSADHTIKKLDVYGNLLWTFKGHMDIIWTLTVDEDKNIYSGSFDNTVRKIDANGNELWVYEKNNSRIRDIILDFDYNNYISSSDKTIRKIDKNGNDIWIYGIHNNTVTGLAVDSNNNIFSASFDNEIHKINSNGDKLWDIETQDYHSIRDIEIDNEDNFYIVSHDDRIRKYDNQGTFIWSYDKLEHNIWALSVDENSNIYTGSEDHIVRKFEPYGNSIIWEYKGHTAPVYDVAVNPVVVTNEYDKIILVGPQQLQVGNIYTYTIDNYDPNKVYNAVTSMGDVEIKDDKLILDLKGFTLGGIVDITITDGYVSTDYSYNVDDHEDYDKIILIGPDNLDAGNVYTYTIDNYFPQRDYSATTDLGEVSVSEDVLTLDLTNVRLTDIANVIITDQHISTQYQYNVKGDGSYDEIKIDGPDPVKSDKEYTYTIVNYYSSQSYNVSSNIGNISINNDKITLKTPDYNTEERNLTISIDDGKVYSDHTVTYLYDDIILQGPDVLQAGEIYKYKIINHEPHRNYQASASIGNATINEDELIVDLTDLNTVDATTITISDENVSTEYTYDIEYANGINIYTASFDNTIRKLDNNGYEIYSHSSSPNTNYSIDIDKDRNIYTGSRDDIVEKFDNDFNKIWTYYGHNDNIYKVVVDDEGNVYTGSKDTTVKKLKSNGEHIWTYYGHNDEIWAIDIDKDGNVYTGSKDGSIRKLNSIAEKLWSYEEHTNGIRCLALHYYDAYLFSGSLDNTVRKISLDGDELWSFTGHSAAILDVATDHNENIYSASIDETIKKLDPRGNEIWSYDGHNSVVYGLETDYKTNIYSASNDRTAKKIHPNGYELWTFERHTNTVRCITVDPIKYDEILLDGPDPVESNKTYEYTITNYFPSKNYNVSTNIGIVSISGDTVTLETPESNFEEKTITIEINDSWVHSTHDVTYLYDDILLDGPEPVESNKIYEYTITNYDSTKNYSVSSNIGSVSINGETVTLETPESNFEEKTITIEINDGTVFSDHNVTYLYDEILLDGPDPVESNKTYEYTITNYEPTKNYNVSSNIGSVSVSGDTVTLETPNSNDSTKTITIDITDGTVNGSKDITYLYDEILLDGPDTVKSNNSYQYTITNYDSSKNYTVSSNIGSVSVNGDTVTLETPDSNFDDNEKTITIDITDGRVNGSKDITYLYDEILLNGPERICVGSTHQYNLSLKHSDGTISDDINVDSWSTSNSIGTVDSQGNVSIKPDTSGKQLTLTATVDSTSISKTISVVGEGVKIRQIEKINSGSTTEVYFDVIDPDTGESVTDITSEDICGVTENGSEISNYTFSTSGDLNKFVDIGISLDRSGSFSNNQSDMNTGASNLIDKLNSSDKAAIINFGGDVSLDQSLTSNASHLKDAINSPSDVGSSTALYDSIITAVNEIKSSSRQNALMVITDGNDGNSNNTLQDAIDAAKNASIPVFLIAFGSNFDENVFKQIADETNGDYDNVNTANELTTTMENFRVRLSQQYVIKYDSNNTDSANIDICVEGYCGGSNSYVYDEILLNGPEFVKPSNTYNYIIANYQPNKNYNVSSNIGSVSVNDDTVTLETPDNNDSTKTITIDITDGTVNGSKDVQLLYDEILLDGPDPVESNKTYEYTITNYDSTKNYSVSTNIGNVSVSGDTVTLETPNSNDSTKTITIDITDGDVSSKHDVTYLYDDIKLDGPDPVESNKIYEYIITNYFPSKNYTVSTNIGSVSVSGDTVTLETPNSNDSTKTITIDITDGDVSSKHDVTYLYDEILLDGPNNVLTDNTYYYTITNYDSTKNYNVSSNIGSVSVSGDTVTLETPNNNDSTKTITIDITDGTVNGSKNVQLLYDEILLDGPDPVESNKTYEYTITNYDSTKNYIVSSNIGSVSVNGDTVTLETPNSNFEERTITININDGDVYSSKDVTYLYNDIGLDGPDPVESNKTYEYTITNYDSTKNYSVSTNIGNVSVNGDTVTLETPDSNDSNKTITIDITDGTVNSSKDVTYLYDEILLDGPDPVESNKTYEYTITNYDSTKNYNVSSNIGSVSVNGDTVTLETPNSNFEERTITIDITDGRVNGSKDVTYLYDGILLDGPDPVESNKTYEYTITNYDSTKNYSVSSNIGSVSVSGDTVTLETPDSNNSNNQDVITINISDGEINDSKDIQILYSNLILDGPKRICAGSSHQYNVLKREGDGTISDDINVDSWSTSNSIGTVDSQGNLTVSTDILNEQLTLTATVDSTSISKTISVVGEGVKIRQIEKINSGSTTEVYFDVIDPDTGESVTDITSEDICGVTENGSEISNYTFSTSGDLNKFVDIGISLDRSGSFSDYQSDMNTGASNLIDKLNSSDKAAIINFGGDASLDQSLTSNASDLKDAINNPSDVGSSTALYDSIITAVNEIKSSSRQNALMVITDGNDGSSNNTLQDAIDSAKNASIPVFLIAFGSNFDENVFKQIADETNGDYDNVNTANELTTTMENFRVKLSQQYVIKYDSNNSDSANIDICVEGYCGGST
ncbi:hypothetical protein PBI_SCTP2_141 [Salicola phage SCTP-2]|nr:hypothetical protein PBI_SCTP2_141 [Salicola phage SCTP-2]